MGRFDRKCFYDFIIRLDAQEGLTEGEIFKLKTDHSFEDQDGSQYKDPKVKNLIVERMETSVG